MPTPANATTLDKSDEDNTTALYRAAIGPIHTNYYLPRFTRFDAAERAGLSWNWAAALFTLNWMAYRQLWGAALAYLGAVVAMALLVFGIGRLVFQFTEETEMGLLLLLGPLAFAIPGALGNLLFYSVSRKKIAQALEAKSTVPEACAWLEKKASSRKRIFWQGLANAALLGASFASYAALSNLDSLTSHAAKPTEASIPAVANPESAAEAKATDAATGANAAPTSNTVTPATSSTEAMAEGPTSTSPAAPTPEAIVVASNTTASASANAPSAPPSTASASPAGATTPPAIPPAAPATVAAAPVSPAVPAEAAAPPPVAVAPAAAAKAARTAPVVKAKKPPATSTTTKTSDAATPAASAKIKATKPRFLINVGLFAKDSNAHNAYTQLIDAGLPATSQELKTSKGKLTRVRVGPFDTQAEADVAASKVRELKLEAVVIER